MDSSHNPFSSGSPGNFGGGLQPSFQQNVVSTQDQWILQAYLQYLQSQSQPNPFGGQGGLGQFQPQGLGGQGQVQPNYFGVQGSSNQVQPNYFGVQGSSNQVHPNYFGVQGSSNQVQPNYFGVQGSSNQVQPQNFGVQGGFNQVQSQSSGDQGFAPQFQQFTTSTTPDYLKVDPGSQVDSSSQLLRQQSQQSWGSSQVVSGSNPQLSLATANTGSDSSSLPTISLNKNRTYGIPDLTDNSQPISGQGTHWHQFSTKRFGDVNQASEYFNETGLNQNTGVTQDWGGASGTLYRSRRGSIGGYTKNSDGSVDTFRWSSYATSQALNANDAGQFVANYETAAQRVDTAAKNTVGNDDTINAVASDVGKVRYDSGSFQLTGTTYASGFSGKGVTNSEEADLQKIYRPTIQTAIHKKNTPTEAQTYHSEGMAVSLHQEQRGGQLKDESDTIAMVTSVPNQVCRNCGDMFIRNMGPNSLSSGMPGRPFGGQKEGVEKKPDLGVGTLSKSTPTKSLIGNQTNREEVANIAKHLL